MNRTAEQAYDDGYRTGFTWDAPWTPGGPWIHSCGRDGCPNTQASMIEHSAWKDGWRDGVRERDHRKKYGYDEDQHAGGFGDGRIG